MNGYAVAAIAIIGSVALIMTGHGEALVGLVFVVMLLGLV